MKAKLLGLMMVSSLATASIANAGAIGFIAEPYLGYALTGGATTKTATTSTDSGKFTGLAVGARALASYQMFFGGLDFSLSPLSHSPATATGTTFTSVSSMKLGIVAGVELPMLPLRFWLGYNFMNTQSMTQPAVGAVAASDLSLSGSGIKLGVGYKVIPLVSVNAEYIMSSYGSAKNALGVQQFATGQSISVNSFLLSVSVPFTLPI